MTKNKKKRQTSRQSGKIIWIAIASLLVSGCTEKKQEREFKDSESALEYCESFLHKLMAENKASLEDISSYVRDWSILYNETRNCIKNDSSNHLQSICGSVLTIYADSVSLEIARLVGSQERTLSDIYKYINQNCLAKIDDECQNLINTYQEYYSVLDSSKVYTDNCKRTIARYEKTLEEAKKNGFGTKNDVLHFITMEDANYKAFLSQLPSIKDVSLNKILKLTEDVVRDFVNLSAEENPIMSKTEVVIMLAVRNNFRIIQNANACIEHIKKGRMVKTSMDDAFVLMLVQPWLLIDDFSFSLLSEKQKSQLKSLATETPRALNKLNPKKLNFDLKGFPEMLLKSYISHQLELLDDNDFVHQNLESNKK